jgi:serine/threonine protein kinase
MPVPITCDEFFDLVRKSGVLDDERVSNFAKGICDPGVGLDQPQTVAQRMIRDGLLTTFQAKQLLQGKFRRFLINGKYRLLEPIGAGGMGQVFLCFHIYMHRFVALKVLPIDKLKDPSMVERFYREARAAGALDHPNIVRAYDIDREQGENGQSTLHYLVMEFVDGASLQELVARKGPLSPERAAHYVKQAAEGLQHAHEAGLVHRDIKPGNLLLDRSGTVKVLDLGLARFFQQGKDNVTERYDDNAVLGTADYLSPEQARAETVDIRADIYSLGATLYFLLAGKSPFEEGTVTQKLLWSQTKSPKSILELRSEVPAELAAVLDRMMAKDPKDRYATPQSVVDALAPWTGTPIPPPATEEMPRRSPAASSPGTQSHVPIVPSTPSPRSVPTDLVRARPLSGGAARATGPTSPAPKQAPRTPVPANGPRSRPLAPIVRGPAPASGRRKRISQQPVGMSTGKILAIAGLGSAGLIILGIVLAWAVVGRKPHATHPTDSTNPTAPVQSPKASLPAATGIIPADQAAKFVGRRATVEMKVARAAKASTTERYFLNSKVDFRASDNFTVTFTKAILDQLASKGIANEKALENRVVRVTGVIVLYNNLPQIEVNSVDQIQIVGR